MYPSPQPQQPQRLFRPADDRVLAGVCSGLARYVGLDANVVRIAWVVFTLLGGSGGLAYLIGWLLMPDANGRRASTPLVLLILLFAVPAMCALILLPFRLIFN